MNANRTKRYCELAEKKADQLYKVSSHVKEEELESVEELSDVCSQIVFKCLYIARTGMPVILWSVNKFARSVVVADDWQDQFHNIHHTSNFRQYCTVLKRSTTLSIGFQEPDFAGDLEESKSTWSGIL